MTDKAYSEATFIIGIDGGLYVLDSFEGGDVTGEVVTLQQGSDLAPRKQLARLRYNPITVQAGFSMGKPLSEWIASTLDRKHRRKSGFVAAVDGDYRALAYRRFYEALISEVGFPALDGSSKEPANFSITIEPEQIVDEAGDGAVLKPSILPAKTLWPRSNFRFTLGDLPCSRVAKMEAVGVKQNIVESEVGEFRVSTKVAARLELPTLELSISAADLKAWQSWFDDFVIRGNNGQDAEKSGSIEFLAADDETVLGSIDLTHVGICSLKPPFFESEKKSKAHFRVELYCETLALSLNYM